MVLIREENDKHIDEIIPIPQFVIKTKIFSPFQVYPSGTKLFINVCTNDKMPTKEVTGMKEDDFDLQKIFLLISEGEWEIPILTSTFRSVLDKKQQKSILIDCVINDKYMRWCMISNDLKEILIQWCFDAVEFNLDGIVIDRDVMQFPKRKSMGGSPESIFIDIQEVEAKVKDLESVGKDLYSEENKTDEPAGLLKAKRLGEEMNDNVSDLSDLVGNKPAALGKPLIIEMDADDATGSNDKKISESKKPKVERIPIEDDAKFEIEMAKLEQTETVGHYKYLIKISSGLKNSNDYRLKFDSKDKDLHIVGKKGKAVKFPLPLDSTGESESFFVKPEQKLYVYMK